MDWHAVLVVVALFFPFGFFAFQIARVRREAAAARAQRLLQRAGIEVGGRRTPEMLREESRVFDFVRWKLGQAGLSEATGKYLIGFTAVGVVVSAMLMLGPINSSGGFLLLGVGATVAPAAIVAFRLAMRRHRFVVQFPEVLEAMVRALQAGYTTVQAMRMISEDYPPPISDEFRQMTKHIQMGVSFSDVLREFQSRLDLPEVQYFVATLILQRESGGQLAQLLEELARIMRRRSLFHGKLRALTAESRFTAWFIGGAPLAYLGYKYLFDRESLIFFLEDSTGSSLLKFSLILIVVGVVLLQQMLRIRF